MDIAQISQLISSLGFPIAMCLILMQYCKELLEEHKRDSESLRNAINSSTEMVSKLDSKIDTLLDLFTSKANEK